MTKDCSDLIRQNSYKIPNEAVEGHHEEQCSRNEQIETNSQACSEVSQTSNFSDSSNNRKRIKNVKDAYVIHDYHDYSMVPYDDIPNHCHSSYHMNHRGGNEILFPQKLHSLIFDIDRLDKEICSWAPHGRCFYVKDRDVFVTKYLAPKLNMSNYSSFQRQLNRYNFKTITKYTSMDRGSYYHELFLRGRPSLAQLIRGQRSKGNGFKPLSSPQDEPDFYFYPYCYEIVNELELLIPCTSQTSLANNSTSSTVTAITAIPISQDTLIPTLQGRFQLAGIVNSASSDRNVLNQGNNLLATNVPSVLMHDYALLQRLVPTSTFSNMTTTPNMQNIFHPTRIDNTLNSHNVREIPTISALQEELRLTEILNRHYLPNQNNIYLAAYLPPYALVNELPIFQRLVPASLNPLNVSLNLPTAHAPIPTPRPSIFRENDYRSSENNSSIDETEEN